MWAAAGGQRARSCQIKQPDDTAQRLGKRAVGRQQHAARAASKGGGIAGNGEEESKRAGLNPEGEGRALHQAGAARAVLGCLRGVVVVRRPRRDARWRRANVCLVPRAGRKRSCAMRQKIVQAAFRQVDFLSKAKPRRRLPHCKPTRVRARAPEVRGSCSALSARRPSL